LQFKDEKEEMEIFLTVKPGDPGPIQIKIVQNLIETNVNPKH
jgi:hypothetical protein